MGSLAALLLCGCTAAPELPHGAGPDELYDHVADSFADGYFESAWLGLRALHNHPLRNKLNNALVLGYFVTLPKVGTLAALLDKKASEAGDYVSFCPDALLNRPLCAEEAAHEAIWFDGAPVRSKVVPQTLALQPLLLEDESPWPLPAVAVALPQEEVALVDTGTTANVLTEAAASRWPDVAERLGTAQISLQDGVFEAPLVRIHALRLGDATFRRMAAHLGPALVNIVGMAVLLRYDAVCFDWAREELVLGSLGRCARGHVLEDGAWLGKGLDISIDLRPRDVELPPLEEWAMQGRVDTGDHRSRCSRMFLEANGGPTFSFGEHPDLVGTCVHEETRDVAQSENPTNMTLPKPVLIGMDTLRRFDAFGWRLRPLRLYLLSPKDGPAPLPRVPASNG